MHNSTGSFSIGFATFRAPVGCNMDFANWEKGVKDENNDVQTARRGVRSRISCEHV